MIGSHFPEALEKIINAGKQLININDSVKTLRIARYNENGIEYSMVSPDNS